MNRKKWTPSKSSNTKFLSGRIPDKLWYAVDNNANSTGRTRTEVMIAAVSQYLGLPNPVFDPHSKTMEIEQSLTALKERLEGKVQELESVLERLNEQNKQLSDAYNNLTERLSTVESGLTDAPKKSMFPVDDIWDKHYGNGKKGGAK